jgi:hypothetical protein
MKCPRCKRTNLRQLVSVFVECNADCRSLSKKGIRKRDVQIIGAGWPTATLFCPKDGCGFVLRLGKKERS